MEIINYESAEFNRLDRDNISRGGNLSISLDEMAMMAIDKYMQNDRTKDEKGHVKDFTKDMLKDIQTQIKDTNRPIMGQEVQTEDIYDKQTNDGWER